MYIYRKDSSGYKYTTQWIHSIQKCLIQHAYTKKFSYTICLKRKSTHQASKKYTAATQHTGKATRTTQPKERKEKVMSNCITQ